MATLTATAAGTGTVAADVVAVGFNLAPVVAGAAAATVSISVNAAPAMLTINGTRLEVLPGTAVDDIPFGTIDRSFGGAARADYRTRNRTVRVVGQFVDVAAWRDTLTHEIVSCGGLLIGTATEFYVRDLSWNVVNADRVQPTFRLEEVQGDVGLTLYYEAVKQADNFYVLVRGSNAGYVPEKQADDFYTFTATYPSTYKLGRNAADFVMTGTTA